MKRIGKFSGNIYEIIDSVNIQECAICITDDQSKDENFLSNIKNKNSLDCKSCFGCPMSKI